MIKRYGASMSPCSTPATMSNQITNSTQLWKQGLTSELGHVPTK